MIPKTTTTPPNSRASRAKRAASTATPDATPAAGPQPSAPTPDDKFSIRRALTSVTRGAAGLAFGAAGIFVNSAAGAGQGVVHGAALEGKTADYTRMGVQGLNLVGAGAISALTMHMSHSAILTAAALNLIQGFVSWSIESNETRERVAQTANNWTDAVIAQLPGGGTPTPNSTPGIGRRIVNGTVGQVAGFLAGTTVGGVTFYNAGADWAEERFNRVADRFTQKSSGEG